MFFLIPLLFVDYWSNPVVADIELPQVEVAYKPVLLNLGEVIVG